MEAYSNLDKFRNNCYNLNRNTGHSCEGCKQVICIPAQPVDGHLPDPFSPFLSLGKVRHPTQAASVGKGLASPSIWGLRFVDHAACLVPSSPNYRASLSFCGGRYFVAHIDFCWGMGSPSCLLHQAAEHPGLTLLLPVLFCFNWSWTRQSFKQRIPSMRGVTSVK